MNEKYDLVLPHENSDGLFDSKELFQNSCDILLVEESRPSFGVGIEVGWADAFNVPIVSLYEKWFKQSNSPDFISRGGCCVWFCCSFGVST